MGRNPQVSDGSLATLQWKMQMSTQGGVVCTVLPFVKVSVSCFLVSDKSTQGLGHLTTLVCCRSSVLQASMLLSPLMVKMKMREKITPNRPLHPVLSSSLSPPWNIQEQIKPLSRQDKIKLTISWRYFLTFFKKNKTKTK